MRAATTLNIRFTSSLTPEDENAVASALLKAFTSILDLLPIAYVVRIDTEDAHTYQHHSAGNATAVHTAIHPSVPVRRHVQFQIR